MSSLLFTALLALSQLPPVAEIPNCEALEIEGRRIQSALDDIQRQMANLDPGSRHSDAALTAGLALNVLGAISPVRGGEAAASGAARALGASARSADRAEADRAQAGLDQRMDDALDRMDAVGARYGELCGGDAAAG